MRYLALVIGQRGVRAGRGWGKAEELRNARNNIIRAAVEREKAQQKRLLDSPVRISCFPRSSFRRTCFHLRSHDASLFGESSHFVCSASRRVSRLAAYMYFPMDLRLSRGRNQP